MVRTLFFIIAIILGVVPPAALTQLSDFTPVTQEMLLNPSPNDWLMYSRTYDNQRFSPLDQINRQNVRQLRMAWARGLSPGIHEHIPLVYRGVLYVANPGGMQALDATNGDLIWEYLRKLPEDSRNRAGRTIAIYEDLIVYAAPDEYLVALDARTGELRWETRSSFSSSGPKVIEGKVIAGMGNCGDGRDCILAFDALTGKELWKFYTAPAPGEPGGTLGRTCP